MAYKRDIEPISKQVTIIIGLTVVGFMAFGLALSFYRNVIFDQTLRDMEGQNKQVAAGIEREYRELDYFRSAQFKDKYAKENLNKFNPGEKVLIITEPAKTDLPAAASGTVLQDQKDAKFMEFLRQMPVQDQWWMYLFRRDALQDIKNAL